MNNIKILQSSIENPEPFFDEFYSKVGSGPVISQDPASLTRLQEANRRIRDNITAIEAIQRHGDTAMLNKLIDEIVKCLEVDGINNSEFTSFWEVNDVSFSIYDSMQKDDKRIFLSHIINKFIQHRHRLYRQYGYSDVTLQVKADSFAHKRSGSQGNTKFKAIAAEFGLSLRPIASFEAYMEGPSAVIYPDKENERLFDQLIGDLRADFKWGSKHEGKRPDFMIRIKQNHLIVEHKHMKEAGGGQNKQISEIIDFISHDDSNSNIGYVSFMDGILFNKLFVGRGDRKVNVQREGIYANLKNNPRNYFVNTHGFKELLRAMK